MRFGAGYRAALRRSPNVRVVLHASVTHIALNEAGDAVTSLTAAVLSHLPEECLFSATTPGKGVVCRLISLSVIGTPVICGMW